ncbi:MAG: DUF5916 domain-containing protein [Gemmatimonadales bacterium]
MEYRQRVGIALALLFVASGLTGVSLTAQSAMPDSTPVRIARGARTDIAPTIDGHLDEAVWNAAPVIADFVQHEPFEGRAPTELTEIRILYDNDAVYIAGRMLDGDTAGIVVGETRRDANIRDTDALLLVLDTYYDRQNGFVFGTTPAGIEYDGQVTKEGRGGLPTSSRRTQAGSGGGFNLNWDGSFDVATSVDANGWYAEFRIPFSTLSYGHGGKQVWGLNISRTIRRRNEEDFWAPIARQYPLYRVSEAGILEGLEAPSQRTVRVTPFALSSVQRDFAAQRSTDVGTEIGGDAKIGLSPSLLLDLTYNTDFAQVEVDEQQINLTRFSLFFPEKRPFFLENAGTFSVGNPRAGGDLGLDLFFSRKIGIADRGTPVPILGGGRLTGKAGGMTLGFMNIETESVGGDSIPANNYSVGRVIRELPNRSRVGALVVSRLNTDSTDDYNLTYAVDGRWGIGEAIDIDAYTARTETPGVGGREHATAVSATYSTRDWTVATQFREVGNEFNPEVGFLPRKDYRLFIVRLQRQLRPRAIPWVREFRPHVLVRDFFGFDGFNQTRFLHFDNAMEFSNGAALSTAVNFTREGLTEPFAITNSIAVPVGTYDNIETLWRFNSNLSAPVSFNGTATVGGFFSGHRKSISGSINARTGTTWAASLRLAFDDIDLSEGEFQTALLGLRVAYSFTPRIFVQSLLQYNNQSDDFSVNVRFGWLNTAGTGLFVVYNEVQQTVSPTGPLDRTFIVKFTRQLDLIQ